MARARSRSRCKFATFCSAPWRLSTAEQRSASRPRASSPLRRVSASSRLRASRSATRAAYVRAPAIRMRRRPVELCHTAVPPSRAPVWQVDDLALSLDLGLELPAQRLVVPLRFGSPALRHAEHLGDLAVDVGT